MAFKSNLRITIIIPTKYTTTGPSQTPTKHPTHSNIAAMETIWVDDMESNNRWYSTGQVTFNLNSSACPDPANRCVKTKTSDGDSYIERTTNIANHLDIVLQVDFMVNSISSLIGEYCAIAYKYDDNEWIVYNEYDQNGLYENEMIYFPPSYTSSSIAIKLGVHGVAGDNKDRCYWDNAILKGSVISTSHPTTDNTAMVIIWNDAIKIKNGWTATGSLWNMNSVSIYCPIPTNSCAKLRANSSDTWIERTTNISNYLDVMLQIDLTVNRIESEHGDYCQIAYKYDDDTWIVYKQYNVNGVYLNQTVNFIPSTSSNSITIQLKVHGSSQEGVEEADRCFWDNAILKGVLAPKTKPTPSPILSIGKPTSTQSSQVAFSTTASADITTTDYGIIDEEPLSNVFAFFDFGIMLVPIGALICLSCVSIVFCIMYRKRKKEFLMNETNVSREGLELVATLDTDLMNHDLPESPERVSSVDMMTKGGEDDVASMGSPSLCGVSDDIQTLQTLKPLDLCEGHNNNNNLIGIVNEEVALKGDEFIVRADDEPPDIQTLS